MFRVKLYNTPSINNVDKKYFTAAEFIKRYLELISKSLKFSVNGIYIRGSMVHGRANRFSDIDFVVLVNEMPLDSILKIEYILEELIATNYCSYEVDVKVYSICKKSFAKPASNAQGEIYNILKKHINFDLYANGICIYGNPINKDANIFASLNEFIHNNQIMYGIYLQESFSYRTPYVFSANDIYKIIKNCIRLAAILKIDNKAGYIGALHKCFNDCLKKYPEFPIADMENFVYQGKDLTTDIDFINAVKNFANHILLKEYQLFTDIYPIKEMGVILKTNNQNHLIKHAESSFIKEPWLQAVVRIKDEYLQHFKHDIHSIYIRGSITNGTAITGFSDIDTIAVITRDLRNDDKEWAALAQNELLKSFDFTPKIDLDIISHQDILNFTQGKNHSKSEFLSSFYIKTQSICIFGPDLAKDISPFTCNQKLAESLYIDIQQAKNDVLENIMYQQQESYIKEWCQWFMKIYLRSSFLTLMTREHFYTRDLYPCYQALASHFPQYEQQFKLALFLAINPIANKTDLVHILNKLLEISVLTRKNKM